MPTKFAQKFAEMDALKKKLSEAEDDKARMGLIVAFRKAWDASKHGKLEYVVGALAMAQGVPFSGAKSAPLIAFMRLVLDLEPRRASEWAKAYQQVADLPKAQLRSQLSAKGVASLGRRTNRELNMLRKAAKRRAARQGKRSAA